MKVLDNGVNRDATPDEIAEVEARIATAAIPVVPQIVPMLNARLALIEAGYWADVVSFAAEQGDVAIAYLQAAQNMRRDNPLVIAWAASRGKSGELDGLFIAAGAMNV